MISMTPAIVSRCRVFQFLPLSPEDVQTAILRAMEDPEKGYGKLNIQLEDGVLDYWSVTANGDVRTALNALELAVGATVADPDGKLFITRSIGEQSMQQRMINGGDDHYYNVLSAFCKSLRGGDADAAIAWFARLIYMGADARVIARAAHRPRQRGHRFGQPQRHASGGRRRPGRGAHRYAGGRGSPSPRPSSFLCESPKSNSVVMAKDEAFADVKRFPDEPVPMHLRDTSYFGADKLGSGKGYLYPHNFEGHYVEQQYMPDSLLGRTYYHPSEMGQEAAIRRNHEIRRRNREEKGRKE